MPVAIGISLEKDSTRGILGVVSGNGKGLEKPRRCRMGWDRKSFFNAPKNC